MTCGRGSGPLHQPSAGPPPRPGEDLEKRTDGGAAGAIRSVNFVGFILRVPTSQADKVRAARPGRPAARVSGRSGPAAAPWRRRTRCR
jgi:hypothetical protein